MLFQPTLPARGATASGRWQSAARRGFQPTLPARGATGAIPALSSKLPFQPTLPARGATESSSGSNCSSATFQPTLPARGATEAFDSLIDKYNFNPRSPHGERPTRKNSGVAKTSISTHAPRTGSDFPKPYNYIVPLGFQPTLPARGATLSEVSQEITSSKFQPTLPARGATIFAIRHSARKLISTHAPRTGSDWWELID